MEKDNNIDDANLCAPVKKDRIVYFDILNILSLLLLLHYIVMELFIIFQLNIQQHGQQV